MTSVARRRGGSPVAAEAWRCIFELLFSGDGHQRVHDACDAAGLSPGLMKALLSIAPGEVKPMKELVGEWRCDPSYVTSLVDGLEERGIVERRAHPTDRRAKVVVVTAVGEAKRAELLRHLHQPPACFAALTSIETRMLRDLLRKVARAAADPPPARSEGSYPARK